MLPDSYLLIGQKLVGNAKIETLKWDILGDFQTLYVDLNWIINIFWPLSLQFWATIYETFSNKDPFYKNWPNSVR